MTASNGIVFDARALPPIDAYQSTSTWSDPDGTARSIGRRGWHAPSALHSGSFAAYRDECEAANIVRVALPARTPNALWGGTGNAAIAAAVAADPDFFVGYGALDCSAPDPDQAPALRERGFVAAVFEPFLASAPKHVDDPAFREMLGACEDLRLPVLVMSGGELDRDSGDPARIERLARRHPRLRIVVVHGGWPRAQETLQLAFQNSNIWLMPDLYFPGLPGESDYTLALRTYLADRMLYASSYPYTPLAAQLERIRALPLDDATLERFLHRNAAELFSI